MTRAKWPAALLPLAVLCIIALAACDLFPEDLPEIPDWRPDAGFITLAEGVWADGNISSSGGEQWFKFTASAATQYIHVTFGTLSDMDVQLYDNKGNTTGNNTNLSAFGVTNDYSNTIRTLTSDKAYYIKVRPHGWSGKGTYRIAFNTSDTRPTWVPSAGVVTPLTEGVWTDGNITSPDGEQWFSFTATTSYQYIHVTFGTLNDLYVQLYDGNGGTVGGQAAMYGLYRSTSRAVTSGQTYYIRVWPNQDYGSHVGTYQIAFNKSSTRPVDP